MNINDIEKQNNENIAVSEIAVSKKNNSIKYKNHAFSDYVSSTNKIQKTNAKSQNDNTEKQEEEKIENIASEGETNPQTNAYIQTFQAMNNEIFDLGLNFDNNFKFNNDIFNYNIDLTNINENDIKLFEGLTQTETNLTVNSFNPENQTFNMQINGKNLNISYKSIEVSKTLFDALENAAKTGKSVRLDFGKDTSVILKIGKDGKLSADFIPNEKAMETVLKNAIPQLKTKLEEQNLPYKEIHYKQYNQKDNQKNNNKEKRDE